MRTVNYTPYWVSHLRKTSVHVELIRSYQNRNEAFRSRLMLNLDSHKNEFNPNTPFNSLIRLMKNTVLEGMSIGNDQNDILDNMLALVRSVPIPDKIKGLVTNCRSSATTVDKETKAVRLFSFYLGLLCPYDTVDRGTFNSSHSQNTVSNIEYSMKYVVDSFIITTSDIKRIKESVFMREHVMARDQYGGLLNSNTSIIDPEFIFSNTLDNIMSRVNFLQGLTLPQKEAYLNVSGFGDDPRNIGSLVDLYAVYMGKLFI